jgi:hypothetical protein
MGNIKRLKDVVDAELEGRSRRYGWRKNPSQITTAGVWFDLSMSPGIPSPKYWFDATPLVSKTASQGQDGGLFHGDNVSPYEKYLRLISAWTTTSTPLPMNLLFCDYLLYYPSVDDGTTDTQLMTNTFSLPRYSDGKGVQMIAVTLASRTGGQQFYITYTNSEGVPGRVSQICTQNTSAAVGTITTSSTNVQASGNPFIGLQSGDSGVRMVESVKMLGVDVGLTAIILVKPLAQLCVRGIDAPVEKDFLLTQEQLPRIYDDAYISALALPQGSLSGMSIIGDIKTIWN